MGPPKAVTVEDSFKSAEGYPGAEAVLRLLVPDLLARLREEWAENGRLPGTLTLKWRFPGTAYKRPSASGALIR